MPDSGGSRGWRHVWRSGAGALLLVVGVITLSLGLVILAGGGAAAVASDGGEALLVVAALVVAGAVLLVGVGGALRPGDPTGGSEDGTEPEDEPLAEGAWDWVDEPDPDMAGAPAEYIDEGEPSPDPGHPPAPSDSSLALLRAGSAVADRAVSRRGARRPPARYG